MRTSSLVAAIAATSSLVLSLRHGFCRHEATADSLRANESRIPKHAIAATGSLFLSQRHRCCRHEVAAVFATIKFQKRNQIL